MWSALLQHLPYFGPVLREANLVPPGFEPVLQDLSIHWIILGKHHVSRSAARGRTSPSACLDVLSFNQNEPPNSPR